MVDLKNIEGTLKFGQFDGTKRKNNIIAFVTITTLLIAGMFGLIYYISFEQIKNLNPLTTTDFVISIFGIVFGFSFFLLICLIFLIKNEKMRNKILLWLQDAVELEAHCETLLSDYGNPLLDTVFPSPPVRVKIRVKFKYNGKHYSKDSGYKNKNGEFKNDYQKIWVKYADKSINILYSPKYDEVIVLKNN